MRGISKHGIWLATLLVVLGAMTASLATAAPPGARAAARPMTAAPAGIVVAKNGGMTLEKAIRQVQRQFGGRIVSAHTELRNGQEIHVIKVLTENGTVRTVSVPGRHLRRK